MNDIRELQRLQSPAPKPQSLCWDGGTLWMGSRETKRIYAIDRASWKVMWETAAPGTPYGLTVVGKELRVICGETADDNRIIRRCVPGHGFDPKFAIPCPDDTGSQLGCDGHRLQVSQWYPKKLLLLDEQGQVVRTLHSPHGICGQVIISGVIYLATTDDEETKDYWLTRIPTAPGKGDATDLARIPFAARALAFDGKNFWTNHREQNQIVEFALASG